VTVRAPDDELPRAGDGHAFATAEGARRAAGLGPPQSSSTQPRRQLRKVHDEAARLLPRLRSDGAKPEDVDRAWRLVMLYRRAAAAALKCARQLEVQCRRRSQRGSDDAS
jgi:hypothetical protein